MTRTCSHEHSVTATGTSRPSFNDLMRNRQPFLWSVCCSQCFMSRVASTSHCMLHCTCSIVCFFTKKEKEKKKMTRLLRHQSRHRESDGAIGWIPLLLECCRDYLDTPKWTTQKWKDSLQAGGNKNRFQC